MSFCLISPLLRGAEPLKMKSLILDIFCPIC